MLGVPLISVLTPVLPNRTNYLTVLYDSLVEQRLPQGWEWEWLIQVDGKENISISEHIVNSSNVHVANNGKHYGTAITLNVALNRAKGTITTAIGDDDVYLPGAFNALLEPFLLGKEIWWSGGGVCCPETINWEKGQPLNEKEKMLYGSTLDTVDSTVVWNYFPSLLPTGYTPVGTVGNYWEAAGTFPLLAGHVFYTIETVKQIGGYPATPTGEDAALLVVVNDSYPGWVVDRAMVGYRQHAAQNTKQEWWFERRKDTHLMMRNRRFRNNLNVTSL